MLCAQLVPEPSLPPGPWKNCLPWNQSWCQKIGDCWPVPKGLVPKQLVRPHPWVSTLLGLGESPRIYNSNKFPRGYWSGGHILRTADPEHEIKFQMIWDKMQPLTPSRLQTGVFHTCVPGGHWFPQENLRLSVIFCSNWISANYFSRASLVAQW